MKNRQDEKDKIVSNLKCEIGHYNEECLVLKKANEELDYELQRVSKELKDIVVHYESEFQEIKKQKDNYCDVLKNSESLLKQKEKQYMSLRQEMRESERERLKAENELKQLKGVYQHFKIVKQK